MLKLTNRMPVCYLPPFEIGKKVIMIHVHRLGSISFPEFEP